jgi:hypothetical protein
MVVKKLAVDAEDNDVKRDLQLRTELTDVTTRLGDEIRTDLLKV